MVAHNVIAGGALIVVWSFVGWTIAHHRRIERELVKDEAMPRPAPRANLLLLLCVILTAFTGWMLYLVFH